MVNLWWTGAMFACLEQQQCRLWAIVLQCLQGCFEKQYFPSVMQESQQVLTSCVDSTPGIYAAPWRDLIFFKLPLQWSGTSCPGYVSWRSTWVEGSCSCTSGERGGLVRRGPGGGVMVDCNGNAYKTKQLWNEWLCERIHLQFSKYGRLCNWFLLPLL